MATINRFTNLNESLSGDKKLKKVNRFTGLTETVSTPTTKESPSIKPYSLSDSMALAPTRPSPFDALKTDKPTSFKLPETVVPGIVSQQKKDFEARTGVLENIAAKQKEITDPLVGLARKPFEAAGSVIQGTREAPLKILNHPSVAPVMTEFAKRTSGTGIVSMIQAVGPKTFEEAYQANREAQAGDPSKLNQFLYQLGDTLPQTAFGVALNFAPFGTGPTLSTAYWTALSASEQIESGGKVSSLTKIAVDTLGDKMLGNSIEAMFKAPAKTLWQTVKQNFVTEGGTEVAQDLLKMQVDYMNAKTPEEREKVIADAKKYFTSGQILMTLGVGGISGALVGTAAYTSNQASEQYKTMTPGERKRGSIDLGQTPPPPEDHPPGGSAAQMETKQIKVGKETGRYFYNPSVFKKVEEIGISVPRYDSTSKSWSFELPESFGNNQSVYDSARLAGLNVGSSAKVNGTVNTKISYDSPIDDTLGAKKAFDIFADSFNKSANQTPISEISEASKAITEPQKMADFEKTKEFEGGPGYQKFVKGLENMVKVGKLTPEDLTILKTVFEGTDDSFLGQLDLNTRIIKRRDSSNLGSYQRSTKSIDIRPHLADSTYTQTQFPSRVLFHEFGHAGYYVVLIDEERRIVDNIYRGMGKKEAKRLSTESFDANPNYHSDSVAEFFAESFSEYVLENKVPAEKMRPILHRLASWVFDGLKRLVFRKEHAAIKQLAPIFDKALKGNSFIPLSDFMANEPPSFKQELQQLMGQPQPKKESTPESIFPSQAIKEGKIEQLQPGYMSKTTTTTEAPIEAFQSTFNFAQQNLPPEVTIEPIEKVVEGEKRTPINQRVRWLDYLRTPLKVFERMGIRSQYQQLLKSYEDYIAELPKNIDKITAWSKEVSPESNERIFRFLDGESIDLNAQEAKVAGEIKTWLRQWADRLGMSPDERISEYITHIFPFGKGGEIPEEIAFLINKKIPGSVYNPFLLQRTGQEGYLKDTWAALDAYVKRATRKVHMDPALAELKAASDKMTDVSQLNYINKYIGGINLRPTELDTLIDNHIKEKVGYMFGARPTKYLTSLIRKTISRAKIGGSITSFAKNLTQGANTLAELGTWYTSKGYKDLVMFGAKELHENGVLIESFIEDRTYSAVKKIAEKVDNVLFKNMTASELVNRGAAYYGAKAKFLDGKITPKEFRAQLGRDMPSGYVPNMEDAIQYGKAVSAKTQFLFGPLDTPLALSSDISRTGFQFQTFGLKQSEFLLNYLGEKEYAKLIRYLLSSSLIFAYIGGAFGMKWDESYKTFRFGMPPAFIFAKDLWDAITGAKDKYGNIPSVEDRVSKVGSSIFTNIVPAGSQIKRTFEGIRDVYKGAVRTDSGTLKYKVDQTPINYVRGALFGPSNLPEAQEYWRKKDEKAEAKVSRKVNRFTGL